MSATKDITQTPYPCISIEPTYNHTATVIWLHGLGDSGDSMQYSAATLLESISGLQHVKFIFPTAHAMTITASKARMNAWFDCYSFEYESRKEDEEGYTRAASLVDDIIAKEEKEHGIPPHRIIIGGLSQGSSTALFTALSSKRPLAGAFVLAGYVGLRHKIKEIMTPHASSLSIFWGHGREDPRLLIKFSLTTAKTFALDLDVPFDAYAERLGGSLDLGDTESNDISTLESQPTADADDHSDDSDDSSSSFGSMEADPLPPPVSPSLAEALGSDALKKPGVRFVTYEGLGHWMNDAMLQDLGVWIRALVP